LATIRAENSLRISPRQGGDESLFAEAFEHAPNGMALLDGRGIITQANHALCKLLGFTRGDLLGLTPWEITHTEDAETEAEQRKRLTRGEIDRYQLVQRFIRKDGVPTWVLLSVSVGRRNATFPDYYILQAESAVRHSSAEPHLAADAMLERMNDAMHEIGNSLTPLMLSTELLFEQTRRGDIFESAQVIFKAARRIAFTLRRLRGIADAQPVAYVGPDRMLDLRLVPPRKEAD
jgi:PAS domain S-box-containing protein